MAKMFTNHNTYITVHTYICTYTNKLQYIRTTKYIHTDLIPHYTRVTQLTWYGPHKWSCSVHTVHMTTLHLCLLKNSSLIHEVFNPVSLLHDLEQCMARLQVGGSVIEVIYRLMSVYAVKQTQT